MRQKIPLVISILVLTCALISLNKEDNTSDRKKEVEKTINHLYRKLQSEQWQHNTPFIPPLTFQHQKGLYSSEVKANIIDKQNSWFDTFLRRKFRVDDNNMFVTNFILMALLEAESFDQVKIDEDSFLDAMDAILTYKDKNFDEDLPIFNFWPQSLMNDTWVATPTNLYKLVELFPIPPEPVKKIFDIIGLGFFDNVKMFLSIFRIPADNDDSSVNAALHQTLYDVRDQHPKLYQRWHQNQYNYTKYYLETIRFAYRPFNSLHNDANISTHSDEIDPRTYKYLYQFIDKEYKSQKQSNPEKEPSLLLATTWIMNEESRILDLADMPFYVNNIDLSVNANYLFGLTKHLLNLNKAEFDKIFNGELQQMYNDITRLLAWGINDEIILRRPDIALVYYPSQFDFFWFISRIVKFLENQTDLPHSDLKQTMISLGEALQNKGVKFILEKKTCEDQYCYWDEFLGNYANKTRGEDRIFATSLAINILLDIYTIRVGNNLIWKESAVNEIRDIVDKAVNYIIENHNNKLQLRNAFFSGSKKTVTTLPYFYPSNLNEYRNGSKLDPQVDNYTKLDLYTKVAWKGFASLEDYEELNKKTWYGVRKQQYYILIQQASFDTFPGFNTEFGFSFPFWSSDPISYGLSLVALSKYNALE